MPVIDATDATFREELKNHPRVVVKYYADWCGSCKLFAPKFKRMSDEEGYSGVTFLNINAEQNPDARAMGGVNNLPFIAVFKDGVKVQADSTAKEEYVREMIAGIL